ncbi:predicted protein [Scheffersomyces stipitis CBS 6054]|uniref:DUF300-domain-containing protein n=1 Tax=Scheffersomyces stipitis (strain ATCC 58785 / CBS 6054 / NBRC 10063 / NRRL Y-11545) TaxID=322104 RepID=A3LYQ8_PICST|nr:predicted protein [Scheffersomyces stipitis CBS 6054]ABN68213.2 predicted protein [Scheffersomyces stipitis CBS 6054]
MTSIAIAAISDSSARLPKWVNNICFYSCVLATLIIISCIFLHLRNYRKPFQQRLMLRIQIIVPLFALSCYSMLINQESPFNKFILEPVREVYEAFVIYTFFSLLTDMLGGERNIIIMTSGREPVKHPGILSYILPPLDISDPYTFLGIKRGILQYVWAKPIICFSTLLSQGLGLYDVNSMGPKSIYLWLTIIYNGSVTMSLYCLAIFWKILWNDLKPFNPVGKFLCVKLIIFASYWQGVILAILNVFQVLPGSDESEEKGSIGVCIQNGLLCVELIGFALGHWFAFSYHPFTISQIPYGRLKFKYAFKDMVGIKDLIHDFKLTYYGDYYKDYKQFDSVEALIAHPSSRGRMSRINQGLRYHSDGKQKHWLSNQVSTLQQNNTHIRSTSEIAALPNSPPQLNTTNSIRSSNEYSASLNSTGTSMRAIYPGSPKNGSPPESPVVSGSEQLQFISEILRSDNFLSSINYSKELLDEDELYYQNACSEVPNYKLDQPEIKRLLNYPIVDEMIGGHAYGYKVRRLRQERSYRQSSRDSEDQILNKVNTNESYRYGSIV